MAMLGFGADDWVGLQSIWENGVERYAERYILVVYHIVRGCIGAYYPETNPLVPFGSLADGAGTPTPKSIPVLLTGSAVPKDATKSRE